MCILILVTLNLTKLKLVIWNLKLLFSSSWDLCIIIICIRCSFWCRDASSFSRFLHSFTHPIRWVQSLTQFYYSHKRGYILCVFFLSKFWLGNCVQDDSQIFQTVHIELWLWIFYFVSISLIINKHNRYFNTSRRMFFFDLFLFLLWAVFFFSTIIWEVFSFALWSSNLVIFFAVNMRNNK